jgi:hypothetical protein
MYCTEMLDMVQIAKHTCMCTRRIHRTISHIKNIVVSISINFWNYSQTQDLLFLELNYNNLIKMNMK